MLEDILEESWTYQEIINKGMQKGLDLGLKQGLAAGLKKGLEWGRAEVHEQWVKEQRQTLFSFVQVRFPELVSLAKQQTASIKDPEALHDLIVKLFSMQTVDEARNALMEVEKQ